MNILITAGGTTEKIDSVRGITNYSTGRLAAKCADVLWEHRIFYVCSANAARPESTPREIRQVTSVTDLRNAVRDICRFNKIDAIIHAMAVSDYYVEGVYAEGHTKRAPKIPSGLSGLTIELKPTIKVISTLRHHAPDAVIVGFKLMDDVSHEELIAAGKNILAVNDCDYVLANDLADIKGENHVGHLINKDGEYVTCRTKYSIAARIAQGIKGGRL